MTRIRMLNEIQNDVKKHKIKPKFTKNSKKNPSKS